MTRINQHLKNGWTRNKTGVMLLSQLEGIDRCGFSVKPYFIAAGPCSAESREQILTIAKALSSEGISCFRAGAWKPRTLPGSFEGFGEKALDWLVEARDLYNIEVCTEVALPRHVEACLKRDIHTTWIGTRTTTSPFAVQELANAMKGTNMCVLVKNPICPEVKLWIGAIERLYNSGIKKIAAVHRGFCVPNKSHYRYPPFWRLIAGFRKYLPDMPLICDPSHISGNKVFVNEIIEKTLKIKYDGYMVEVHNSPGLAMTDSAQQLSLAEFHKILEGLRRFNDVVTKYKECLIK